MRSNCAAVCAALLLFFACAPVWSQDVTLTSRDGQVEITGTLLGFDGEFYRVQTIYGDLTIDGSGVACEGPACPSLQDFVAEISLSGSASMGSVLMPALIEGFARQQGLQTRRYQQDETHFGFELRDKAESKLVAKLSFRLTTTDEGFADLLANETDIVMALREIRPAENERARVAGMGDMTQVNRSHVLALDGIVPVVAPGNPVTSIAPSILAEVYAGRITNWKELGGVDATIAVHAPSLATGLGQAVEDQVLLPAELTFSENTISHSTSARVVAAVLDDPFAIGVTSFADARRAQPLLLKGGCGRALNATRRSIKTEDYPLTAPLFLYTPARRLPRIGRDLMAYLRTPEAQVVIRRAGFVDQAPEEISVDEQGYRFSNAISAAGPEFSLQDLQSMTEALDGLRRLTMSFRFTAGSTQLDAQSRSNVAQLAQRLEQGRYDGRRLVFVGFSDGEGAAAENQKLSEDRAVAVRDAVRTALPDLDLSRVQIDVDAFGEMMPMACDDSPWGRLVNRRVEVWVQ